MHIIQVVHVVHIHASMHMQVAYVYMPGAYISLGIVVIYIYIITIVAYCIPGMFAGENILEKFVVIILHFAAEW